MNGEMLKKAYNTSLRQTWIWCVLWNPYWKKQVYKLERMQKYATRMMPELMGLSYE